MNRSIACVLLLALCCVSSAAGFHPEADTWPGFTASPHFGEQVKEMQIETGEPGVRVLILSPGVDRRIDSAKPGVRLLIVAPGVDRIDPAKPTRVVFFATPNGNTIEQTLGCRMADGLNWHYDIQHIAAQHRKLQEVNTRENLVLVCLEAEGLSWPRWRAQHQDNAALIRGVVRTVLSVIPLDPPSVTLVSHSGGGSFMFGFINGSDAIPDWIDRIIFLDSNYGYDDADRHGDKLIAWLNADAGRRLIVIAYDDREITYKGKKVVGPTGGTFRATHRMLDRFKQDGEMVEAEFGDFDTYDALNGRARLMIHPNSNNLILHTRLVGEMNGYLHAMTLNTPEQGKWGTFGGPRAYMQWVQPPPGGYGVAAEAHDTGVDAEGSGVSGDSGVSGGSGGSGVTIPPRPADALGGRAFMKSIAELSPPDREAAIRDELLSGNVPGFLRRFVTIHTLAMTGDDVEVTATYEVAPDYLAIGSDEDFVRVPMTPMTAQAVADAFGCTLATRKMVNDIYNQAQVKLAPLPLTEDRDAVTTFLQHNGLIEWQRRGKPLGALVGGIKKDVVVTNRLQEKPNRVAIYGWHKLDGAPIQPLSIVHVNTYVDYSHGVRLIRRAMRADGETTTIDTVLADPDLAALLSDEGTIEKPRY